MAVLENCEPKRVFHYFEEICKIPHGSGNTKQISDYLVQFAKDHDLKYVQDEMNNVVIYKPGTAGYENAPVVIIQGHMDMVCEKRPVVEHDFSKDGSGSDGDDRRIEYGRSAYAGSSGGTGIDTGSGRLYRSTECQHFRKAKSDLCGTCAGGSGRQDRDDP